MHTVRFPIALGGMDHYTLAMKQLRRLCSMVLMLTIATIPLAAQSAAPAKSPRPAMDPVKLKSMLINVPTGSPLRVRTRDGAQVAGKLTQLTNDGVELQALIDGNIQNRTFSFTDIAGVASGPQKSLMARALGPVLTIVGLAGTVGALTAAIKKK